MVCTALCRRGISRRTALALVALVLVLVLWVHQGRRQEHGARQGGREHQEHSKEHIVNHDHPKHRKHKHNVRHDPEKHKNHAKAQKHLKQQQEEEEEHALELTIPAAPLSGAGLLPPEVVQQAAPGPAGGKVISPAGGREAALLQRMEQSLLKAAGREEVERAKLPKPRTMLAEAVGPVGRLPAGPGSARPAVRLVVVARAHTGFPVIGQFLGKEHNFFQHGEPPPDVSAVANLLNCVLSPELVLGWTDQLEGAFGRSPYFREDCLLDSRAVCGDPLSYETACGVRARQAVRARTLPLATVGRLLREEPGVRVVYLARDPRGVLAPRPGGAPQPKQVCAELLADLTQVAASCHAVSTV
jgi:hypothetical protein